MPYPYPTRGVVNTNPITGDADVFPQLPGVDFTVEKTPIWSTGRKKSASGRMIRSAYFSAPLYQFKLQHNVIRDRPALQELKSLWGFYNSRQGGFATFFYQDPFDNAVTAEPLATGDGATTTFQFVRQVGKGTPYATVEPVYALWLAPSVYFNGVLQSAAGYTINAWGTITFNAAPANGVAITWTGGFLYVAHFDDDTLSFSQMVKDLWEQKGLTFTTDKP
jgi:uncharacterized protein (TIGR02217 family)